jgi:hypothetical protein
VAQDCKVKLLDHAHLPGGFVLCSIADLKSLIRRRPIR